jgi:ferredoxin/flavodoxin---NADP+ reductase
VHCFGRRGPAQAAFTPIEIREFGELHDAYPVIDPQELVLNEASQKEIDEPTHAARKKNYDIMTELAKIQPNGRSRKFFLHFFRSPIEILGKNRVEKVVFERNQLFGESNNQKVRGTGVKEEIGCGIVFRSVGYYGVPIKGLPFTASAGVIPNQHGRIMDSEQIFTGLYAAGWIKRGPTGIIGTNKLDSEDTVHSLSEDLDHLIPCPEPSTEALLAFLKSKEVLTVNFPGWKKIDAAEIERGKPLGKPREKFTRVSGMLSAL